MNGVKDLWQLDPDRGQFVHVKKATVINFLGSDPPERQPVGLRIKQFIQRIEATRIARFAIDLRQRLLNCLLDLRCLGATTFETPLDDFFFANALRDAFWVGLGAFWQIFERRQNTLQFRVEVLFLMLARFRNAISRT